MSTAELMAHADNLNLEERGVLAAYLLYLRQKDDPEHRRELGRRVDRMAAGSFISMEKVKELHEELVRRGV
jgi:hypothetical protein